MNETKRATSTARKLNRSWMWRTLLFALLVDVLVIALVAFAWVYNAENLHDGGNVVSGRHFSAAQGTRGLDLLDTLNYHWSVRDTGDVTVPAGPAAARLKEMMIVLAAGEIVLVLLMSRSGLRRTRKLLRPLDELALQTRALGGTAPAATAAPVEDGTLEPHQVHTLEDAISKLAPDSPQTKIETGDRELHGIEQAINDLLVRMRESNQQQARFLSDASHELRTPIAVLQGYVDLLDRWGKDDPQVLAESITAIRGEVGNMKQLIEQLLFLARGDSGRTAMSYEQLSLTDMLREVHEESQMIDSQHTWRLDAPEEITIVGDAAMLKQTARILVDNAAKYTPANQAITLRAGKKSDGTPFFLVQDNGIGIASSDLPQVFNRFFRSDPARGRQTGGTGLGLAIAKWIVEQHGGFFELLSREEVGTRITVCLPQKKPQELMRAQRAAQKPAVQQPAARGEAQA